MLLKNKNAIVYGGGGAIGGAVAKAFAREGANVFIAGRTLSKLQTIANEIQVNGGKVEITEVDALDEQSVHSHLKKIFLSHKSIDISFNAISFDDVHGTPLAEMQRNLFVQPVVNAMNSHFITATAAIKYMSKKRAGVILAITANAARKPYVDIGGFGVTCAAIEGLCRQLALENGPKGIRVICLRSAGSPDAPGWMKFLIYMLPMQA